MKGISLLLILASFFAYPSMSQADIISFFGSLTPKAEAQTFASNSQSVPLPEPIAKANNIKGIYERELAVDDGALSAFVGPLGTAKDADELPVFDGVNFYTVRSGDTVGAIAKMFNVSPETIYLANDIQKGQALKEGTNLVVLPVTGIQYTVKKGDTISTLAKKFDVPDEDIIFYNDIDIDSSLKVGTELIIPNAKITPTSTTGNGTKSGTKTATKVQNTTGYFIRPCNCAIRTQGKHGSLWHNGVDITSGHIGTPVVAAATGVVIIAKTSGWNGGAGNYVMIQHGNGSKTMYAHLDTVTVVSGQSIKQGEQIGTLGNSGHSTGAHLHFEVSSGFTNPIVSNARYGL